MTKKRLLLISLILTQSFLANAAEFMHYVKGEKLPRAQTQPEIVNTNQDLTLEVISQIKAFSLDSGHNKFFLTTPEFRINNENVLIEVNESQVRASFYFSSSVKVADIHDKGMRLIDISRSNNFVLTCKDNDCLTEIYSRSFQDGLWKKVNNPSGDDIQKYKDKFIALFFKVM